MKRKLFLIIISFLFVFGFNNKVYAVEYHNPEEYLCGNKNINSLLTKIRKVKAVYEFNKDDEYGRYFSIKIMNFSDDLILKVSGLEYTYKEYGDTFYLFNKISSNGGKVSLDFYGGMDHPCAEQYMTKKSITIPKYNIYSELDACIEYEEFPLCAMYYDGEIKNEAEFNEKLKKWIDDNKEEYEVIEQSFFDIVKEFIEDNQLLIAIIVSIIVIIIVVLIVSKIIRRVKRQKIKL